MELVNEIKKAGFTNVSAVIFEKYNVEKQLSIAYCADFLIGVHGAGLHW